MMNSPYQSNILNPMMLLVIKELELGNDGKWVCELTLQCSSLLRKCRENRNKRYLECPGMLKMKHLKKFIIKKYGLNGEEFLVEMIYKDEIIPEEYSVIDVAYLHNYRKVMYRPWYRP